MAKLKQLSRGRQPNGAPNPVDIHVGKRIRLRRQLLGLSQEKLSEMLGLTFQQVQKYERGMNRVGASRLWDISKVLQSPVALFYDDMPEEISSQSPRCLQFSPRQLTKTGINTPTDLTDPMQSEETIELVKAYYKIPNRKAAKYLLALTQAMSKSNSSNNRGKKHAR